MLDESKWLGGAESLPTLNSDFRSLRFPYADLADVAGSFVGHKGLV